MKTNTYSKQIKILDAKLISCYIYHMNPGGIEKPHYHNALEIEYVLNGNSSTHNKGKIYLRKAGKIHKGVNDSNRELVFINIMIPAETESNTFYTNEK